MVGAIVTAPVPRFRGLLPTKLSVAFHSIGLFAVRVIAPPLVLSILPPLGSNVPVPRAVALLTLICPAERVVCPE